ncbi:DUF7146 domain-containing protein [Orrella marina]|uniref:Uncharacterized protein n=1 Tax=Orrella marina TaxID=2163011 RepID=A0A2R4XJG8_9BURK|nr:toprim domain-containing protein [Orrella marina]AWB33940.1 hypothetical protein DBV39_09720 [Orrella marina]
MIDYTKLQAALTAGGLIPGNIKAGSLQRCKVTGDKGGKRSGAYRLFDDAVPVCLWWNWKTAISGKWISTDRTLSPKEQNRHRLLIEQARREREQEQAEQWERNRQSLVKLWEGAYPLTQTCAAGIYLDRRGLCVPNTDALRFVPRLNYWQDGERVGTYPAMLAAVTDPAGELVTIHRTYLTTEGAKAPVSTVKKLCPAAGVMRGSSIKIGQTSRRPDGRLGIGVSEGIETGIAATMLSDVSVWPCVSTSGLMGFEVPEGVGNLYIFADHDESNAGQDAATKLAQRTAKEGVTTRILTPPKVGDWNDELIALQRGAAV